MSGTPLRVLLVEDSEDDALLMVRELRRGGYAPNWERLDTGAALSAALEREAWDLVLSDHVLPQFSALATLRMVQERSRHLPVIVVSGEPAADVAPMVLGAGARGYVSKDTLSQLVPAVRRALPPAGGAE